MTTASDRFVDLSLRILTLVVGIVLAACLALLVYRWVMPSSDHRDVILVPVVPKPSAQPSPSLVPAETRAPEVLMAPGKMYRCVVEGRAAFTDRPCEELQRPAKQARP